jgi:hypothetical protein
MKTKRYLTITLLAGLLLALLLTTACQPFLVTRDGQKFSGAVETRKFDFSGFTEVEIGIAFEYEIIQADTYSISITAYPAAFEELRVVQQGDTLKIGRRPNGSFWTFGGARLAAVITMPQLTGLDASGATEGVITGFSSAENLDLELSGASRLRLESITAADVSMRVSGASRVTGDLTAADTDLEVSGASTVQLGGTGQDVVIDGSGASHLKLAEFRINNADISLSGASDAAVNPDGELDLQLSGASDLDYYGQPTLGKINLSGGSTIKKR